jgi:hypothetical protein
MRTYDRRASRSSKPREIIELDLDRPVEVLTRYQPEGGCVIRICHLVGAVPAAGGQEVSANIEEVGPGVATVKTDEHRSTPPTRSTATSDWYVCTTRADSILTR